MSESWIGYVGKLAFRNFLAWILVILGCVVSEASRNPISTADDDDRKQITTLETRVPLVTISPSSLNFGFLGVGSTSSAKTATLQNNESSPLTITSIVASGDFAVVSNTCNGSLPRGGHCQVTLTFAPSQLGIRLGKLTVVDTARSGPQTVSLSGVGTLAGLIAIAITPANVSLPIGSTQQFTATGTFPNGIVQNLTDLVFWKSSTPTVATISNFPGSQGMATGKIAGTTNITAISLNGVSGSTSLNVGGSKAQAAVTLSNLLQDYDSAPKPVTVTTAPSGLNVIVTYNGSSALPINAGGYAVVATVSDPNYQGSASATLTINKASQTITFTGTPAAAEYNSTFTVAATASSGLPVTIMTSGVCLLTGNTVRMISGVGTCTLTASQPGNSNYEAAPSVTSFAAAQLASATVFANPANKIFGASDPTLSATEIGFTALDAATIQLTATRAVGENVGTYTITPAASGISTHNYNIIIQPSNFTITQATPVFSNLAASQAITFGTSSINLSGMIGAGSLFPPSGESVSATINGAQSIAFVSNSGSFTISFDTTALAASTTPYVITYNYPGDTNFAGATDASTTLTVGQPAATLNSIQINPANSSLIMGSTNQFTATGIYSDNSTQDLTNLAAWSSSAPTAATVGTSPIGTPGRVNAVRLGTTIITAAYGSIAGSTVLSVTGNGGIVPGGTMTAARDPFTATLLPNGQVLMAGGFGAGGVVLNSAEVSNSTGLGFSPTGSMSTSRANHTATLLNNGKVLIVGGMVDGAGTATATAELYNPIAGTFSPTGTMNAARSQHTATLLQDGTVLIAGGYSAGSELAAAEVYDPAQGTFKTVGSLNLARYNHTATLLSIDGTVLIAGGKSNGNAVGSAEVYDPFSGIFSSLMNGLNSERYAHTATPLNNGTVLFAGGLDISDFPLGSAELYSPSGGSFAYTADTTGFQTILNAGRAFHSATLLNNGMVLVAGGTDNSAAIGSLELYDPDTGRFLTAADISGNFVSLTTPRYSHAATLLTNGSVLIAGGTDSAGDPAASTELYLPLTLTPPTLTAINVTPLSPPGPVFRGNTLRFVALDQNGQPITSVTWKTSDAAIATVSNDASNSGTVQFIGQGSVRVSACAGSVCGFSSTFTVGPAALLSITVTPARPAIQPGGQLQFLATGAYTDGTIQDLSANVNWSSSDPVVATINSNGLASGATIGQITIEASSPGPNGVPITGSATLTVTNITLVGAGMKTARANQRAVVLGNGQVLLTGGVLNFANLATESSAELYDPTTQTFDYTRDSSGNQLDMTIQRQSHSATVLIDGRVLVAGGRYDINGVVNILSNAEIYDPVQKIFAPTGGLSDKRDLQTATRLNDGTVLITGGHYFLDPAGQKEVVLDSTEIYSSATGTFTHTHDSFGQTTRMNTPRINHTATLLNNGKVLITGGSSTSGSNTITNTAELYDPATGIFTATPPMNVARWFHTATLLQDGTVLVCGGDNLGITTEIYDPVLNTFTPNVDLPQAFTFGGFAAKAILLENGMVMLEGGGPTFAGTALYDPGTGFTRTGELNVLRGLHSANLLNDGSVLFAGGEPGTVAPNLSSAELYPAISLASNSQAPPNLTRIVVTPDMTTLQQGRTQQFIATGTFIDPMTLQTSSQQLASVTWSSSLTTVTITNDSTNSGMAYVIGPGAVIIKACAGTVCGSTTLTVQ